jgi:glyoxylase I family protein
MSINYEARRDALRSRWLDDDRAKEEAAFTGGVDHLALICLDMDKTIAFYTDVMGMTLKKIVTNRDEPTSTHVFLDMGGGNLLAFFDFPEKDTTPAVRGLGSMHHVALKAAPAQYRALLDRLDDKNVDYSIHGDRQAGSVYFRDPDNILVEVKTAS